MEPRRARTARQQPRASRRPAAAPAPSAPAPGPTDHPPSPAARAFGDGDFKERFQLDEFVRKLKGDGRRSQGEDTEVWGFDPAPLLALFTESISQLEGYGGELDSRIRQTVAEGRVAEGEHKAKLGELEDRLEQDLIRRIATLEDKANSFTETAVQIGDRLEKIHDTKQRATECGELMQHLDELQQHKHANFDERTRRCRESFAKNRRCVCDDHHTGWSSFFRAPPFANDVHMVAKFVKQLRERALDLSSVLGSDSAEMKLNTESYCEELETHLQAEFFAATEQSNYGTMKRCAETLEELSGLHSENVLISTVSAHFPSRAARASPCPLAAQPSPRGRSNASTVWPSVRGEALCRVGQEGGCEEGHAGARGTLQRRCRSMQRGPDRALRQGGEVCDPREQGHQARISASGETAGQACRAHLCRKN